MNKEDFLQHLKDGSTDPEVQLQCCQYFVDNYPVWVNETRTVKDPFGNIIASFETGGKILSSLVGYSVKNDKFAMKNLSVNFEKLRNRVDEIIKFNEDDKK